MKKKIWLAISALTMLSAGASAISVDSVGKNYKANKKNQSSVTLGTQATPSYQSTEKNASSSWTPSVNLDNATGMPAIDLSRATGSIKGTEGVSDDIKSAIGSGQDVGTITRTGHFGVDTFGVGGRFTFKSLFKFNMTRSIENWGIYGRGEKPLNPSNYIIGEAPHSPPSNCEGRYSCSMTASYTQLVWIKSDGSTKKVDPVVWKVDMTSTRKRRH